MRLEKISLKNFKAFKDAVFDAIPPFCVVVGANGTGKSTLFNVFEFLKIALTDSLNVAMTRLGGGRGFDDICSRNCDGPIEIELKSRFQQGTREPLATYFLSIDKEGGKIVILRERLSYRRGSKGTPWHFLDFQRGEGKAVINEPDQVRDESQLKREDMSLKSPDTLALKVVMLQRKFPAAMALGELITNWHISDFHIARARPEQEAGFADHLSREGENLALVAEYLYKEHREVFNRILDQLKRRVPGISDVQTKVTDTGRVLLRFQDGSFVDPFLAQNVSDGTIKMFAYLILLHDPSPHPLLCVEEPENQLYPKLLGELAEEFRDYARRGGQVMVSTHSPDFLNACKLDEVYWLEKIHGYTKIHKAKNDKQIAAYMSDDEEKMGYLWSGLFEILQSESSEIS
jgi:predicted ATPase